MRDFLAITGFLFLQLAFLALIRARRQSRTRKDHLRMQHATGGLRQKQGRETGARGNHRDSNGSRAEQGRLSLAIDHLTLSAFGEPGSPPKLPRSGGRFG